MVRCSLGIILGVALGLSCGGNAGTSSENDDDDDRDDQSSVDDTDGDDDSPSAGRGGAGGTAGTSGSSGTGGSSGAGGTGGSSPVETPDAGPTLNGGQGGSSPMTGGSGGSPAAGGAPLLPPGGKLRPVPTANACLNRPTDLAFDPRNPGRLWITNYGDHTVCIVMDARMAQPASERRVEALREHYLPRPMALAFGGDATTFGIPGTWASANDSAGDSNPDDGQMWNGITLWSSSLDIFGKYKGPNGNSHLDMLHDSPLARGIAWEKDNIYWVFGSMLQDITRYDFARDHDRGNADHSDGSQWHYAAGMVKGKDGVPSHLAYDPQSRALYIADTGNKRVAKLDTMSGTLSPRRHTRTRDRAETRVDAVYDFAKVSDVVPASFGLGAPSGLELDGNVLYVSDNDTGIVHAFDLDGKELGRFPTGRGAGAIMGLAVGPDRKLYMVDSKAPAVLVLEAP